MSVVLITGCSSGFGYASALAFARRGDIVYASMRSLSKAGPLKEIATREALDIRVVELEVTSPSAFAPLIARIVREAGKLDVLVNNAGLLRAGAFEDLDETALRSVMETNFFAPFLLARAVLPQMRAQRSGYIIMISSLSGVAGLPGDVAYTASKFAVEGATESLRHEVDRWGIKLALVEGGLYATRIFDSSLPGTNAASDTATSDHATSPESKACLPPGYPANSPYRALIEHQLTELRARLPNALDPALIGELLVTISQSDGRQLRWPADAVARKVLATLFAQDDAARDAFLQDVAGTQWWTAGGEAPSGSTSAPASGSSSASGKSVVPGVST
ncbi:MAG: SDR family oxidoreductase [Gammaproteobacteria bacterium]